MITTSHCNFFMKSNLQDHTVGICEELTRSIGKTPLSVHGETGVFLWDEYAPKMAAVIQIYSNKTALCSRVSLHVPIFLDADGPSPKAIKTANVRGIVLFVFFSFSLIYTWYIRQGVILHRTSVCMKSCLFEGLIQGYKEATFLVLQVLHLEPTSPKGTS